MESIDEKILKMGQKRETEALTAYVESLDVDMLIEAIKPKVNNAIFVHTWNYLLQSFTDCSHWKRLQVVQMVLKEIEANKIATTQSTTIVQRLCMEFLKFKTEHLVELCDVCVVQIQSNKDSQMCWKDLLPELLNVIVERDKVENDDKEITGLEYKHEVINSLCVLQWAPEIVTSLTLMFIDTPLTKEEHARVVHKLGTYIEKMTPQEVPPFVYQLLRLGKNDSKSIFLRLQNYFGPRVYENYQYQNESDSNSMDLIENASDHDVIEAESTVLFHIHSAASLGNECFKTYLNSLKNVSKSPEFILHPFQLTILLVISTIPHYEEKVFEILRSAVARNYHEEEKKINSAWLRSMLPTSCNLESIFTQIITLSSSDRELVLQGLVNFSFVLLGVGVGLGRDPVAEKQWHLGSMILFKIIKRKRHVAPVIIQTLSNRILTEHSILQYIECLYMMTKNLALLMLENKSTIISLMEGLLQIPENNANHLLDVIIPLSKISPTIRDHFIILLRKALYSRISDTRRVAVNGFLKLLTNLKISNLASLSQSTCNGSFSSGHSIFTQISMNRASQSAPSAFSNEALCFEILSILRRCFMQQAEVRTQFYTGLYETVCNNPELGVPVLEVMWSHFSEFYNTDEDALPPFKLDKVTATKDIEVTLQEPLGKLVYTIGLILTKVAETEKDSPIVVKFTSILDSTCSRMIQCELVHFELDDGTDLLDTLPECQHKLFVLKELMNVYEALIGYKIFSWNLQSEGFAQHILNLYQGYCRLTSFAKNLSKPKKAEKKKKNDDANRTTQTANTTQTNTPLKKDNVQKSKASKVPNTLLDFQVLVKTLALLHEPIVPWTSTAEANVVKKQKQLHQHIMQATLYLITSQKNKKNIEGQNAKAVYNYLCDIAMLLYETVIKRLVDFIDFDCASAILALECFLAILNLICNQYKSNLQSFLRKVGGGDRGEDLVSHLTEFAGTYQKLLEIDEEQTSDDPEIKKLSLLIVNTLNVITNQLPTTSNSLSNQMLDWLNTYAINSKTTNKQVATSFVTLMFDTLLKFKVSLTPLEHISLRIGDVTGMVTEEEHAAIDEFKIVNDVTVHSVLLSLCASIKSTIEYIDFLITRLQSEHSMIVYPGQENVERRKEYLKSKERGVCSQLCFVVTLMTNVSNCTVPPGNLSEAIWKNISLLFCTLSSLTKYFTMRSSKINPVFQSVRFERLVKLAGKELAPVVYKLISYIEDSQRQETEATQGNKKKKVDSAALKSKVLKQTRFIPKVVYEIEQFSKHVIQLSKKTKIDLSKLVGQGTVRDFRFMHLKEILQQGEDENAPTQENDSSVANEDETLSEEEEGSPPPAKRRKH